MRISLDGLPPKVGAVFRNLRCTPGRDDLNGIAMTGKIKNYSQNPEKIVGILETHFRSRWQIRRVSSLVKHQGQIRFSLQSLVRTSYANCSECINHHWKISPDFLSESYGHKMTIQYSFTFISVFINSRIREYHKQYNTRCSKHWNLLYERTSI